MANIGIIGAGISSLHLGIRLRDAGVEATIYAPKRPEEIAAARLPNSVSHQADTIARERAMGIEFWNDGNCRINLGHEYWVRADGMPALEFWGDFAGYSRVVDYRLYLPRMMAEFERRGGRIVYRSPAPADIDPLYEKHDLLAIGVGKGNGGFADFFPRQEELSKHREPARLLCCGIYEGVNDTDPLGVTVSTSVGHGELIVLPIEAQTGQHTALLFECRPDGDMADLMTLDYAADPVAFHARILKIVETHHDSTYERIDRGRFRLARECDLLQGSFTPVTRKPCVEIADGRFAIATGDLHCTMDPVTGQGANLASYGAGVLADHIINAAGDLDAAFCAGYEEAVAFRVAGTVNFNNAILEPAPYLPDLMYAMANNRPMCDDFTERFARPETIWFDILKDAETCERYMAGFEPKARRAAAPRGWS